MTFKLDINLDDEQSCREFLDAQPTMPRGGQLARQLGFRGRGAYLAARALWNYAINRKVAFGRRRRGNLGAALQYESICDRIYTRNIMKKIECW